MLFFWQSAGRYRWLLLAYPAAMAFTLVYSGEHFVIDIIVGWIYATVVYIVGTRVFDRWIAPLVGQGTTRRPHTVPRQSAERAESVERDAS